MIAGMGTDIISVDRISQLIQQRGMRFLERWFSPREIEYCHSKAHPDLHFAARIAAKEAVLKALRISWNSPMKWQLIEINNDQQGIPSVSLTGRLLEEAKQAGITNLHISLSHCQHYAAATAIAEA